MTTAFRPPAGDATQRELHYRKKLVEIANAINSASSIHDILTRNRVERTVDTSDGPKCDASNR